MTSGILEPQSAGTAPGAAVPTAPPAAGDSGLGEALRTIRKRKWIILAFIVAGLAYGWYKSSTQVRLYVASGTIEIGTGSTKAFSLSAATQGTENTSSINTEVAILKSDALLLTIARDLDLANNPDFMGSKGPMPHLSLDDPAIRQGVIGILNGDLIVATVPKTNLVRITCSTLNAKLSADIVNKLIAEYIQRSIKARVEATTRASEFLSPQLRELKQQVEDSQTRLIDLGRKLGITGVGADAQAGPSNNLTALTSALGQAQIRRILSQSRYQTLNNTEANAVDNSIDPAAGSAASTAPSPLASLRSERETAEAQYAELTANLGPRMPAVKALHAHIEALNKAITEEQNRLLIQARQNVAAARTDEETLHSALDTERADAYKRRDDLIAYNFRQREYESLQRLYDALYERLRTASVQAGLESTEIDVVDTASPPVAPSLQPRSTMLVINTVVLGILGIIVAFIVDSLDTGIQSVAELETLTGLPSLTLIPRSRRVVEPGGMSLAQRNIGVLSGPKSQFAEAFRALRTSLLLSTPGGEPRTILLTSSTPSEGKTTAAANLATVLAQRDVRVLLVDADLRRPAVHHRFGINGKIGLTSVLSGAVPFDQAVQHIPEIPNLDVLVSGPVPPFPAEMLGSASMVALLEEARSKYTHIVLDSPPLLSVADSIVLAQHADAVLLVVRYGKSSKSAVRRGRELLVRAGVRTVGIALNAVETNSPEYYAYYGYSGYTSYGSSGVESSAWESKSGSRKSGKGDRS